MTDLAVRAEGLGKRYRLGETGGFGDLREALVNVVSASARSMRRSRGARQSGTHPADLWALRDVSLDVREGEVVGIIGRNGAGKSTLLKILSRITEPTEGWADVHGRVSSLLEVGTGFHRQLTGRENIYLNGSILGMKRREIRNKFDEIVDFSGIAAFLDTPVKRYSSGMYVRLAFAVAAHLEPDILVVDEVLAVGDVDFQKKCLGKMQDVARGGRTVLFVSHNMQAISTLTERCYVLSGGRCVADGKTDDMIAEYLRLGGSQERVYIAPPSSYEPKITRAEVVTSHPDNIHVAQQPMEVRLEVTTPVAIEGAAISFQIRDSLGRPLVYLWRFDSEHPMCREPGKYTLTCDIPRLRLHVGHYDLVLHFGEQATGTKLETIESVCPFEVVMYGEHHDYGWSADQAVYLEEADWHIEKAAEYEAQVDLPQTEQTTK
jgi:lipopolysaccharide transport system ATP-binding protein